MRIKKIAGSLLVGLPISSSIIMVGAFYFKKDKPSHIKSVGIQKLTIKNESNEIPDIKQEDFYDLIRMENNLPYITPYLMSNLIKRVVERMAPILDVKISYSIITKTKAKILIKLGEKSKEFLIELKY